VAALALTQRGPGAAWIHNRVLATLLLGALFAALGLAFLSVAPNRLVSGTGLGLRELASPAHAVLGLPFAGLVLAIFVRPSRAVHAAVVVSAALLLAGLVWLAGAEAARQSAASPALTRVSLGGGFWAVALLVWLMAADALQRLGLSLTQRTLAHVAVLLPLFVLLGAGALDQLSLLKEYANRDDVFRAAGLRHGQIVAATLLPSLLIGVPLGVAAARSERLATPLFAALNVIQTVPSIALFALLIAPLSGLAAALPGWGIRGIGLLPAVIALTLYALLPIVHGTASGLRQVPAAAVAAATGMGMTVRQVFWRVEVPLALPVLLSGLRVTTVQVIGLAVVAALIGAGGFGALVFQGLASSALDLVMLGVLPVVALAIVADAGLELAAAALEGPQP
jgi:osmoprotectant transport system permease protein